jgi:hypothetical protein
VVSCLIIVLAGASLAFAWPESFKQTVVETRLCDLPLETTATHPLVASPDGRRVAHAMEADGQWQVLVNGLPGSRFDEVRDITFSPDGRRVAYQARTGEQWRMVVDGQEGRPYQQLGRHLFSSDSRHLAVSILRDGQWRAVIDGLEGAAYDEIRDLAFAPAILPAYTARLGAQWCIVVGRQQGKLYDGVRDLRFSADGTRRAYVAQQGKARFLVVDGTEKPHYDDIGVFGFSPDGRRFAYAGKDGEQQVLVIDDVPAHRYDHVYSIVFSPDSRRLGYHASREGRHFVVIDSKEGKPYDFINLFMPLFSPDSRRYAYAGGFVDEGDHFRANLVIDGETVVSKTGIAWLAFSPDSRHVVCAGADDGWTPIINGKERDWRGGVGRLLYSPDSRHVVFTAGLQDWHSTALEEKRNNQWWVVVDGTPGPLYDLVLDPSHGQWTTSMMDENGKARYPRDPLTYSYSYYRQRQRRWQLTVDFGETVPFSWQRPPEYQGIFFDAPDRIRYLAVKEQGIYLVETSPPWTGKIDWNHSMHANHHVRESHAGLAVHVLMATDSEEGHIFRRATLPQNKIVDGKITVWIRVLPSSGWIRVSDKGERIAVLSPRQPNASGMLTVYDANGRVAWEVNLPAATRSSSMAISPQGDRVWCDYWTWDMRPLQPHEPVTYTGGIICYNGTGQELWRFEKTGKTEGTPVCSPYGYIVGVAQDNKLLCVTPSHEGVKGFLVLDGQGRTVIAQQPNAAHEDTYRRVEMDPTGTYLLISENDTTSLLDMNGKEITRVPGEMFEGPGSCVTRDGTYILLQGLQAAVIPRWPEISYPPGYPEQKKTPEGSLRGFTMFDGQLRGFTVFDRWGAPTAAVGSVEMAPAGYRLDAWPEAINGRYIGGGEIGGDTGSLAVLAMHGPDWYIYRLQPLRKEDQAPLRILQRATIPPPSDPATIVRLSADGSRVVMLARQLPSAESATTHHAILTAFTSTGERIGQMEIPLPSEKTEAMPVSLQLSGNGQFAVALSGTILCGVRFAAN